MPIDVQGLMRLWTDPPAGSEAAEAAFGRFYADSVTVDGARFTITDLVARVRGMHVAFAGLHHEVLDLVQTPDRVVVTSLLKGTHAGPLHTPLGTVQATGRDVAIRTVDVLAVVDDRVVEVWVIADQLGLLTQLDAVALAGPS